MADFIDVLARDAQKTVDEGYYHVEQGVPHTSRSLKTAVLQCRRNPIIAEVKLASPSLGVVRANVDVEAVAMAMERGGAVGVSVLTEPRHFRGSLNALMKVRRSVGLPLLMKDVVISPIQLEAASKVGADAVLLIKALFDRGYCERNVDEMVAYAHSLNLEVLLEAHTEHEFLSALKTEADLIGINNRNLGTLNVNIETTLRIMQRFGPQGRIIVSESGIENPAAVRALSEKGVHAFLIGAAIMRTEDVKKRVREFVMA